MRVAVVAGVLRVARRPRGVDAQRSPASREPALRSALGRAEEEVVSCVGRLPAVGDALLRLHAAAGDVEREAA